MACEICGSSNCCRVFHSIEEQNAFDEIAEPVTDRIRNRLSRELNRLATFDYNDDTFVRLSDVQSMIDYI